MSSVLPILFNTDMVRAISDGHKTATRRVVKGDVADIINSQYHKEHPKVPNKVLIEKLCRAPYETGDILYVRETWALIKDYQCIGTPGSGYENTTGSCPHKSCKDTDGSCFPDTYICGK